MENIIIELSPDDARHLLRVLCQTHARGKDLDVSEKVEKAIRIQLSTISPDIVLFKNFIVEHKSLFEQTMNSCDWDKSMNARWTASFGVPYEYNGMEYPVRPFPEFMTKIIEEISATIIGLNPNNCLINLYHNGESSMGFHSDNLDQLVEGTGVAIISLGSTRTLRYKNKIYKDNIHDYELKSGSLVYMDDDVQAEWLHAIPKCDTTEPRISLTFRQLKTK